jgi:hypothetical protein
MLIRRASLLSGRFISEAWRLIHLIARSPVAPRASSEPVPSDVTKGFSGSDAATAAQGYFYKQLQHQVSLLSFMDCFRVIAWVTLAAVPLLLLVQRFKPAAKAPTFH